MSKEFTRFFIEDDDIGNHDYWVCEDCLEEVPQDALYLDRCKNEYRGVDCHFCDASQDDENEQ